jgi:ubiquinone/menaquinone biosynthesis C-methylase UbiE
MREKHQTDSDQKRDIDKGMGQCKCWDSVASGYRKWWKQIEGNGNKDEGAQKVSLRLLELTEVRPGHTILDIATGYGEPAVSAAQCVGSKGYVLAIDSSPHMLEIAKERSTALGFQNITFKDIDIEELVLPSSFFDVAVCRWGLMFLSNLNTVLKKIYDALFPGGRFAAAVWSYPSKVPLISLPMDIITREIGSQIPQTQQTTLGPFSLSDINVLEQSFIRSGFTDIRTELVDVTFELPSAKQFVQIMQELSLSINMMLSKVASVKRVNVLEAITDGLDRNFRDKKTGHIRLTNEVICIAGQRGVLN